MSKGAQWKHKQRHKKFDYTVIADRLRTVSWSNYSLLTGVVKPVWQFLTILTSFGQNTAEFYECTFFYLYILARIRDEAMLFCMTPNDKRIILKPLRYEIVLTVSIAHYDIKQQWQNI